MLVGMTLGLQYRHVDLDYPIVSPGPFSALEFGPRFGPSFGPDLDHIGICHFPHARRRAPTEATGFTSRLAPWKWISFQVREFPQDPNWQHARFIDEICGACSRVSQRVGTCEYPVYVTPESAKGLSDLWNSDCPRRAELHPWGPLSSPVFPNNENPDLMIASPVAVRNEDRAGRRRTRAFISPISDMQGPLAMADGPAPQDPSDAGMVPDHP